MNKKVLTSLLVAVFLIGTLSLIGAAVTQPPQEGVWLSTDADGKTEYTGSLDFKDLPDTLYLFVGDPGADDVSNPDQTVNVTFTDNVGDDDTIQLLEEEYSGEEVEGLFRYQLVGSTGSEDIFEKNTTASTGETLTSPNDPSTSADVETWPGDVLDFSYSGVDVTDSTTMDVDVTVYLDNTSDPDYLLKTSSSVTWNFTVRDLTADTTTSADSVSVDLSSTESGISDTVTLEEDGAESAEFDVDKDVGLSGTSPDYAVSLVATGDGDVFKLTYDGSKTASATVGNDVWVYDAADSSPTFDDTTYEGSVATIEAANTHFTDNGPGNAAYVQITDRYDSTTESRPVDLSVTDLTLQPASDAVSVELDYTGNATKSALKVTADGITIEDLTISGKPTATNSVILVSSTNATIDGNDITVTDPSGAGEDEDFAAVKLNTAATVSENTITGNTTEYSDTKVTIGLDINTAGSGSSVSDNKFVSHGTGIIERGGGDFTAKGNTLTNIAGTGIIISDTNASSTVNYDADPDFAYNKFSDMDTGVWVNADTHDITNLDFEYNSFTNIDSYAIYNDNASSSVDIAATYNYWNATSGPEVGSGTTDDTSAYNTDGTGGVLAEANGEVTYRPWLNAEPAGPSSDNPNGLSRDADDNTVDGEKTVENTSVSSGDRYFWTIKAALDSNFSAGNSIDVDGGTYTEMAGKDFGSEVTLTATSAANLEINGSGDNTIEVKGNSSAVTIDGFTVEVEPSHSSVSSNLVEVTGNGNSESLILKNSTIDFKLNYSSTSDAGLQIDASSYDASATLKGVTVKAAGRGIYVNDGSSNTSSLTMAKTDDGTWNELSSNDKGLYVGSKVDTLDVDHTKFLGNSTFAVDTETAGDGLSIEKSTFIGNAENTDGTHVPNVTFKNQTSTDFTATDNYWGDSSGPYHPANNPDGEGQSVDSYVIIDPYWTKVSGFETIRGLDRPPGRTDRVGSLSLISADSFYTHLYTLHLGREVV